MPAGSSACLACNPDSIRKHSGIPPPHACLALTHACALALRLAAIWSCRRGHCHDREPACRRRPHAHEGRLAPKQAMTSGALLPGLVLAFVEALSRDVDNGVDAVHIDQCLWFHKR